ncbi:ABC transporter ATP-binding protein [Acetobacterium wieringae]|uniref:ABC transporter ATP-binding protein n=1 Tax=Acetobacterium wieringae TaxID=52694 RepID=A0A5D0WVD2_9FIRM|nr:MULTISPECIES: ABC transporter ATP-binding protein [Acetobacterium]MEA4804490.1 ABC transporter ATP-binding protein [Acetobacterium wieringae]OXS24635.1 MAG: macrolide ABC transporter ATP-binding protein [Acetobacterium sp. MES1]TYC88250.1 ABC transporter ATP-binding protein [Acetobacterium wieringae]URN86201.1 ABC transporter ATP-binding protein [Acetobacterium wieringae]UYO64691.1 ABC transporter ATP-binding protein [Acetobacterium wieringae]
MFIQVRDLHKDFKLGKEDIHILKGIDLDIEQGEMVALLGPSGSGKSTFLNVLGGLVPPTSGDIMIRDYRISDMTENELCLFRREHLGFIFQSYNLISTMTAMENVALALTFAGVKKEIRQQRAQEALEVVGLVDRMGHKPSELSGGQQQRVSIARALVNHPEIILADEPTGNLDSKTSADIMEMITRLNREEKQTFVIVTHDPDTTKYCTKVIHMCDGLIEAEVNQ